MAIDDRLHRQLEEAKALREAAREDRAVAERLRTGPARRISEGMPDISTELVDAKIAAAEARGQTALVGALGDLRADIRELKASTASKGTVVATGVSLFFGLAALLAAFLAFGGQMFGVGSDSGVVAQAAADRAVATYAAQHPK